MKWKFQAEIYILVGMGRGERQINDLKMGMAFGNLGVGRPGEFWFSFSYNFENRDRENAYLGEIYNLKKSILLKIDSRTKKYRKFLLPYFVQVH